MTLPLPSFNSANKKIHFSTSFSSRTLCVSIILDHVLCYVVQDYTLLYGHCDSTCHKSTESICYSHCTAQHPNDRREVFNIGDEELQKPTVKRKFCGSNQENLIPQKLTYFYCENFPIYGKWLHLVLYI